MAQPSLQHLQNDILTRNQEDLCISDRVVLWILLAHLPFVYLIIPAGFGTHLHGAIPATLVVIASWLAYKTMPGTLLSRSVLAASLMIMSMIVIMQQYGRLEMHFHIFAALAFLIIWRDYRVLLLAAAMIAVHHALAVPLQLAGTQLGGIPFTVYGQSCDWQTFAIHAAFVVIETSVLMFFCHRMHSQFMLSSHVMTVMQHAAEKRDLTIELAHIPAHSHSDRAFVGSLKSFYDLINETLTHFKLAGNSLGSYAGRSVAVSESNYQSLNEQNQRIESVATATEQMNQSIGEVAKATADASRLSAETSQVLQRAKHSSGQAVSEVQLLTGKLENVEATFSGLSEDIKSINAAINLITEISEQTSLLSLNASIEAARAGEQGRGFSVVAEEVRQLAQKSKQATASITETAEHINSSVKRVVDNMAACQQNGETAINSVHLTSQTMDEATQSADRINDLNQHIAAMMEEQSVVATQISQTMHALYDTNSEIITNIEDSVTQSRETETLASDLLGRANLFNTQVS